MSNFLPVFILAIENMMQILEMTKDIHDSVKGTELHFIYVLLMARSNQY